MFLKLKEIVPCTNRLLDILISIDDISSVVVTDINRSSENDYQICSCVTMKTKNKFYVEESIRLLEGKIKSALQQ